MLVSASPRFLALLPAFLWMSGCSVCGDGGVRGAGEVPGARDDRGAAPTTIARNLSDADIVVESVEQGSAGGYVLRGRIIRIHRTGGSGSIAGEGQALALTPLYPGGEPDSRNDAHRRLMGLSRSVPGDTVRCRIALDGTGAWRITSAD